MSAAGHPENGRPRAATALADAEFVRLVGTADGDALAAAGLLTSALEAIGTPYQVSLAAVPDPPATDADCTVAPGWIRSMVRRCTPETTFVAGPVVYEHEDRFFPRLQALELMGLVAFGAGTLGVGLPTFCNSANVAYRRDVMDARDRAPDGAAQDEILLQYVAYASDREVVFNPDPNAVVTTAPAPSFMDYLQQQARWAQMGLRYPFQLPRLLVLGLWAGHSALFVAGTAALALPTWREPVLLTFLGKIAVDALMTVPMVRQFGQHGLLRSAVPTELFLLFSVPLIGLLSAFGDVEWKGRELD